MEDLSSFTVKEWQQSVLELDKNLESSLDLAKPDALDDEEDMTEIFKAAASAIPENGLLAKDGFSLETTMNAYDLMNPKMDVKHNLQNYFNPTKFEESGLIKESYSELQLLSLLNLSLRHEINMWQGHNQYSNVFSLVFFAKDEWHRPHPEIHALVEYIKFINFYIIDLV